MVQCISKMLQMVKYLFEDERDNKKIDDLDLDRGIICQIQIVLAISSDFCSLLSTLLLTLRVYDVIKNKKKFFDQDYVEIICISLDIGISIILGIIFLMIDRYIAEGNVSYRYDVRDRCTYWCWLEHISSLICFGFYVLILIFNIFYAFKTYCFLRKGYIKLLEEADFPKNGKFVSPLGDIKSQVSESEENNSGLINTNKKKLKKIKINANYTMDDFKNKNEDIYMKYKNNFNKIIDNDKNASIGNIKLEKIRRNNYRKIFGNKSFDGSSVTDKNNNGIKF